MRGLSSLCWHETYFVLLLLDVVWGFSRQGVLIKPYWESGYDSKGMR